MSEDLNWAVLGTGVIANEMAQALAKMNKKLYAVGNRTYQKALDFAGKYEVQKVYEQIDDMFVDEDVDIIYITSPHNTHYQFMKKALESGTTENALYYEIMDMENAVKTGDASGMCLEYSKDVMDIMTKLRKDWNLKYPNEEW